MSRHSKWHKVRQFKGAIDAKRSASFTKLAREISVAVREKGTDPSMNVRLRVAIERARKAPMPKDNIERVIQRGGGAGEGGELEQLTYEGYGPGGAALIIECVTDNRNRTANDVKHLLSKHEGALAASGAVTYAFDRKGVIRGAIHVLESERQDLELELIDRGADDVVLTDTDSSVQGPLSQMGSLAYLLQQKGMEIESAEGEWIPRMTVSISESEAERLGMLVDSLEDLDDVASVHTNAG